MDFVVGRSAPVTQTSNSSSEKGNFIEAKVLHVREPRRRKPNPDSRHQESRQGTASSDPAGARVLVMLVPDAFRLPDGLDSGDYRVFLRFVRK